MADNNPLPVGFRVVTVFGMIVPSILMVKELFSFLFWGEKIDFDALGVAAVIFLIAVAVRFFGGLINTHLR